jgi:hypothetical protein
MVMSMVAVEILYNDFWRSVGMVPVQEHHGTSILMVQSVILMVIHQFYIY